MTKLNVLPPTKFYRGAAKAIADFRLSSPDTWTEASLNRIVLVSNRKFETTTSFLDGERFSREAESPGGSLSPYFG
jgi:hypothetical protein